MIGRSNKHTTLAYYRDKHKPDDDMEVYDLVPIIPCGKHFKRDYHREVAWTIDYRGDNDDVPTLLFVGAGYTLIKAIFIQMFGNKSYLFSGFRLYRDYYHYQRQGKAWVRIAIELRNYNFNMMPFEDLGLILANKIKQQCLCNIKFVKLAKFLNL